MQKALIDNRYKKLKILGSGATGTVHKVKDIKNNRVIALKILSKKKTYSETIQRFKREFRLLSELRHPNLCTVYDFGTLKDGRSYFTMEYVDGKNIFQVSKGLSYQKLYSLIVQLCRALQYIHSKGLIHYDIKPANVLIQYSDNTPCVKLMDFCLAREKRIRGGTLIRGTLPYIAPEVIKGMTVDHRADLYSLGVVLYQIFTRKLFTTKTDASFASLLEQQHKCIVRPLSKIADNIPQRLEQLVERLLTVEPAVRYSWANEIIDEINKLSHSRFDLETEKTIEGYLLSSKFVGREKEMEMLRQFYKGSNQGKGKVVLITGDAGFGKSRLLKEFKVFTQLEHGYCFTGYAYKERVRPLEPFYDVFRELINYIDHGTKLKTELAILFRIFPELAVPHLKKKLPKLLPLEPRQEKLRNFDAFCELIRYAASNLSGMVILLEDLHWADGLTNQFLEYLGRNLENTKVLICVTGRQEELEGNETFNKMMVNLKSEGYFGQIELKPLDIKNLYSFLDSTITSRSNSPGLVKYLMEKTRGNPYFVEEIMRSLLRMGKVSIGERIEVSDISQITIPATIEGIVNKRIKDSQCDAQEVMRFAAVLLRGFDYGLMKSLTGFDDTHLSKALWELNTKQILTVENNVYWFYHAILREAVNKHLGVKERKKLNYRIGKTIEILHKDNLEHVIGDLAHYFINARHKKKGKKYGLQAAKNSSMQYAAEQAIKFYRGVLGLLERNDSALRFNLLQELGRVEIITNLFDDAINHYRQALNLKNGAIRHKAKLFSNIGMIHEARSEYRKALRIYQRGLKLLKKMRPSKLNALLAADIKIRICSAYQKIGDYKRAETFNFDGLKIPKVDMKDREAIILQASIYNTLAYIEAIKGGYKKIHCERAIDYYKKSYNYNKQLKAEDKMATTLVNLGVMYIRIFDLHNAFDCYQRALKISKKRGFQRSQALLYQNIADYFLHSGDYSKVLDYLQQAFSISKKISHPSITCVSLLGMGRYYLMLCEYKKSQDYNEKALSIIETIGWKEYKITAFNYAADIQQALGNYTTALRLYKKALQISNDAGYKNGIALSLVGLGSLFVEIGEFKAAKKRIRDALTIARAIERTNLEAECYLHLCQLNLIENDTVAALKHYIQGSRLAQQISMKQLLLKFWLLASEIFYHEKKYSRGVNFTDRVIQIAKSAGLKDLYAVALLLKAKHELNQDMLSKVEYIQILEDAQKIAEAIDCPEIIWKVYFERGKFLHENGKFSDALDYYTKCLNTLKEVSGKIKNKKYAKSYLNRPDRKAVFTTIDKM